MRTSLAVRGGAPGTATDMPPTLEWGSGRRSFWSRRRQRTLVSIITVMALIAGLAVAFKLYSQRVPNNVVRDASNYLFDVLTPRIDIGDGDTIPDDLYQTAGFDNPIFKRLRLYPGDSKVRYVKIDNTKDPNLRNIDVLVRVSDVFVCRPQLPGETVRDTPCLDADPADGNSNDPGHAVVLVRKTDPRWNTFLSFIQVAMGSACTGTLAQPSPLETCTTPLIANLGADMVSGVQSFTATELDVGDQSAYKGWLAAVTFLFQARTKGRPSSAI